MAMSVCRTTVLCVLLAAASAAQLEPPVAVPEPSASEILARMVQSYESCKSYRDAGVVEQSYTHRAQPEKGPLWAEERVSRSVKPFRTAFIRPSQFRFEYSVARGESMSRYIVWQDGPDVRTWWDVHDGEERPGSLGMAIAGATGVSSGAAHTVPRLMIPMHVGGRSAAELANLERLADSSIDDVACFRLKGLFAGRSTRVLWIDQASLLIRRIEEESDGDDYHSVEVTNYEPERDVEVSRGELAFDPPPPRPPRPPRARSSSGGGTFRSEDFEPRFDKARRLVTAGDHDAALLEFEGLWTDTNNPDSAFDPRIRGPIIQAIGQLAAVHPATKVRFGEIFDELDATVRRNPPRSFRTWTDWADLGRALELDDRIVQLYVDRRSPTGTLRVFADIHPYALDDLFDILLERRQFAEAGRITIDPLAEARMEYDIGDPRADGVDDAQAEAIGGSMLLRAREDVGRLHALTLAADRPDEAEAVAKFMLTVDDTVEARWALVLACLHSGAGHRAWRRPRLQKA